ncbi:MFS transporter [Lacibacterium aquatile]|uniref:MFS transporter n=1 Tax=Lacibacterium aquatile TaxID=1168082 RepID=A0ABW5DSJ4_9PROT
MSLVKRYFDVYRGLPAAMWWLAGSMFVWNCGQTGLAFTAVYLAQKYATSATDIGIVLGAAGLGRFLAAVPSGWLADRVDNRRLMIILMAIQALAFIPMVYFASIPALSATAFVIGMCDQGLRPPGMACALFLCPPEDRMRGYGLNRLAINAGLGAGTSLGGLIYAGWADGIFWVNSVACIAATLMLLPMPKVEPRGMDPKAEGQTSSPSVWLDKDYILFCAVLILGTTVFMQFRSTLATDLVSIQGVSPATFGFLIAFNCLAVALFEMPVIAAIRRFAAHKVTAVGVVLVGVAYGSLAIWGGLPGAIIWMILWTLSEMALLPASMGIAQKRAEKGRPGETMAIYSLVFSIASTIGPLFGGYLLDHAGGQILWGGSFFLCLASALAVLKIGRKFG